MKPTWRWPELASPQRCNGRRPICREKGAVPPPLSLSLSLFPVSLVERQSATSKPQQPKRSPHTSLHSECPIHPANSSGNGNCRLSSSSAQAAIAISIPIAIPSFQLHCENFLNCPFETSRALVCLSVCAGSSTALRALIVLFLHPAAAATDAASSRALRVLKRRSCSKPIPACAGFERSSRRGSRRSKGRGAPPTEELALLSNAPELDAPRRPSCMLWAFFFLC